MTDREVQKLSRRDLLALLLSVQEENEDLRKACEGLHRSREELRTELAAAKVSAQDASARAAALLQEARLTADDVQESRKALLEEREKKLNEMDLRLKQREEQLAAMELQHKAILNNAAKEATAKLQQANASAAETLRQANEKADALVRQAQSTAARTEQEAAENAEKILRRAQEDSNSFWQDVSGLLQKQLDEQAGK
ncbi:MAG: hypothetical protein K6C08_05750 [Oscillospiraceae bacterium]|nr:hypothetical protein [Oscillospiraceae bacterium]